VCVLTILLSAKAQAQSNPAPPISQSARILPPASAAQADPKPRARILESYGKLPLSFEANTGQTDSRVKFLSRGKTAGLLPTTTRPLGLNLSPAVTYGSGGLYPESVAVADVNGDGKPDLVVANSCGPGGCYPAPGVVGVLLGNGDGTFQTAVSYSAGGTAYKVVIVDVNGDGKPDLVMANGRSNTIAVLLGNGDGTFKAAVTYDSGGSDPLSVAVADVNGDGKLDLVVANVCVSSQNCSTNSVVGVLLGNGDGTFQAAVNYGSGGCEPTSVAVADVNGDGRPDLLVGNSGNGNSGCNTTDTVGVLLGNGDGTLQTAVVYDVGGGGSVSLAVSDVNADGKLDLLASSESACSNCSNGAVEVLLGNGDGTFQKAISYASGGSLTESLEVADVNGDGKPDLVVANLGTNTVAVLINTSLPATTTALASLPNPSSSGQSVTFTATVTSQGSGTPTGTVTFTYGSTTLCNGTILSGGTVACAYSALPVGSDTVTARYSGDTNFNPSSGTLTQTVNKAATTTTLTSSLNLSNFQSASHYHSSSDRPIRRDAHRHHHLQRRLNATGYVSTQRRHGHILDRSIGGGSPFH
jgi:hypothetical protein